MKQQKGVFLVEVLVSMVLLAMLATPFLSLFVQSEREKLVAEKMLYANYAATNQMEKLAAMDCKGICSSSGEFVQGDMLIRSRSTTWAVQQQPCFYFIFQDNGLSGYDCMIIPTDCDNGIFLSDLEDSIDIQIEVDMDHYEIWADTYSISGEISEEKKPIIMVNAVDKPEDILVYLNVVGSVDVVVYSQPDGIDVEFCGDLTINENVYYRDYTLFRSVVEVYDVEEVDKLLSRVESILRIPN